MIAVAENQALQFAQRFRVGPDAPVFIQHQHAQLVAGIEQFRRGRVVRRA